MVYHCTNSILSLHILCVTAHYFMPAFSILVNHMVILKHTDFSFDHFGRRFALFQRFITR